MESDTGCNTKWFPKWDLQVTQMVSDAGSYTNDVGC